MKAAFRTIVAIASLLVLAVAGMAEVVLEETRGNVSARATVSRDVVLLSEDLTLELEAEGPARLTVVPPQPLLSKSSAQAWRIREMEWPLVQNLGNERQRWKQSFRLSPYETGASVEIALVPLKVRSGSMPVLEITWQRAFAIRVTTSIVDPDSQSLRPITGIEGAPARDDFVKSKGWPVLRTISLGVVVVLMVVLVFEKRRRKTIPIFVPDANWAVRELHELVHSATTAETVFGRLANILRQFLSHRFGFPATRLTTGEVLSELLRSNSLESDTRDQLQSILEQCDLAKFAPRLTDDADWHDRNEWIDKTVQLVRQITSTDPAGSLPRISS